MNGRNTMKDNEKNKEEITKYSDHDIENKVKNKMMNRRTLVDEQKRINSRKQARIKKHARSNGHRDLSSRNIPKKGSDTNDRLLRGDFSFKSTTSKSHNSNMNNSNKHSNILQPFINQIKCDESIRIFYDEMEGHSWDSSSDYKSSNGHNNSSSSISTDRYNSSRKEDKSIGSNASEPGRIQIISTGVDICDGLGIYNKNKEIGPIPFCKFCYGTESGLISPCLCKGSIKYVHTVCLKQWRFKKQLKEIRNCEQCYQEYKILGDKQLSNWYIRLICIFILISMVLINNWICNLILDGIVVVIEEIRVENGYRTLRKSVSKDIYQGLESKESHSRKGNQSNENLSEENQTRGCHSSEAQCSKGTCIEGAQCSKGTYIEGAQNSKGTYSDGDPSTKETQAGRTHSSRETHSGDESFYKETHSDKANSYKETHSSGDITSKETQTGGTHGSREVKQVNESAEMKNNGSSRNESSGNNENEMSPMNEHNTASREVNSSNATSTGAHNHDLSLLSYLNDHLSLYKPSFTLLYNRFQDYLKIIYCMMGEGCNCSQSNNTDDYNKSNQSNSVKHTHPKEQNNYSGNVSPGNMFLNLNIKNCFSPSTSNPDYDTPYFTYKPTISYLDSTILLITISHLFYSRSFFSHLLIFFVFLVFYFLNYYLFRTILILWMSKWAIREYGVLVEWMRQIVYYLVNR